MLAQPACQVPQSIQRAPSRSSGLSASLQNLNAVFQQPNREEHSHARLDDVKGVVEGGADAGRHKAGCRRLRRGQHLAVALLQHGTQERQGRRQRKHVSGLMETSCGRRGRRCGRRGRHPTHLPKPTQQRNTRVHVHAAAPASPSAPAHVLVEEDAVAERLAPEQAHLVAAGESSRGAMGRAKLERSLTRPTAWLPVAW